MRSLLAALTLALLAAPAGLPVSAPSAAEPSAVTLKSLALIEDDVVRLGDLFDGLGAAAETAVARAPEPGKTVELGARWLAALARGYELPWQPASRFERILVERHSRVIEAERIQDELLLRLAAQSPQSDFQLSLDNPALEIVLPADADTSLAIRNLVYNPSNGRFRAQLVVPAEGPAVSQTAVSGRAVEMIEIPVLVESVAPGSEIRPSDIDWKRIRADRNHRGLARDLESLAGKSPRRPITIGQPVRLSDLREPVTVAKNTLVVIRLSTPSMTLTTQGRALEDGATGAAIRVMNTKSNAVINATVVRAGMVEVATLPQPTVQ